MPINEVVAYHTSKAALEGLCQWLANHAAPRGIRVNIVVPGLIDTALGGLASGADPGREQRPIPLGRQGTGWEVAYAAAFLLSHEASYITGHSLVVDGGLVECAEPMARLPYIDNNHAAPAVCDTLEVLLSLNIFRMLAHAESAFVPYLGLAGVLLTGLELDPRLRELAILLVAARTGAEYEWIQHVGISQALGVPEPQISAVERGDLEAPCLDERVPGGASLRHAGARASRPDDDTFAALNDRFPPRQIVELLLVIGSYHTLARIMTTLDVDLDEAIGTTVVDEAHRLLDT